MKKLLLSYLCFFTFYGYSMPSEICGEVSPLPKEDNASPNPFSDSLNDEDDLLIFSEEDFDDNDNLADLEDEDDNVRS